jgi:acyl-CoA thioester hydrolase
MHDPISAYPFQLGQDIIWRDMDANAHVNNAVYFRYFEDVRMALLQEVGAMDLLQRERIGPILASTRCDFRAPLDFPDRIRVGTRIEDLHNKRFTMKYAVHSERLERIAAEGEGLIVYYDYDAQASCAIPADLVPRLQAYGPR